MRRLVIVLLALLVVLVVADRVLASVAGHVVADKVRTDEDLSTEPSVTIHGFPFLTQALGGDYSDVQVTATDVHRGGVTLSRISADLYDVRLPLSQALHGSASQVPVDRTVATVTMDYSAINAFLASKHITTSYAGKGELAVSGTLSVAGQQVAATGTGSVTTSGNRIVVRVDQVSAGGVTTSGLAGALDFSVPLTSLPFGVSLTSVDVSAGGVSLHGGTGHIVLGHEGG